jgi:putative ABC transport system permease protein
MKIPLLDGRDFCAGDTNPSVAIVNETFAKRYFGGENPLGRSFNGDATLKIVGLVRDARYIDMRGPMPAVVYLPYRGIDRKGALRPKRFGTLIVRTGNSDNPLALASTLRREVPRARPEFRVSNIRSQEELNRSHTTRERLLAMLAVFFAGVALLLAGIGLYGVLDYGVLQRRREIGIRMAIGAQPGDIARRVTADVFAMVTVGAVAGLALGMGSARYIEALLFQVRATDAAMMALPSLAILFAASVAAAPAVVRAIQIDPVTILRSE